MPTSITIDLQSLPKLMYKQFCTTGGRYPAQKLPIEPFSAPRLLAKQQPSRYVWFGHSALLMRIRGKTLLIDPMLGPDTSPTAPFRTERFSSDMLDVIDQFPPIDLILISHDHYDHLDYASILRLQSKASQYFVALGVARHLIRWGIPPEKITEFDWWDHKHFYDIDITFTPTRHFSGRGLTDRAKSLWGGWAFRTVDEKIYFSGDSGYGSHFADVGKQLGPFDFAFMESGQYNENWPQIHMYPEESVQAALDAKAKACMPVHWGAFALAQHHWKDPVVRFLKAASATTLAVATPAIGHPFTIVDPVSTSWWEEFD